MVQLKKLKLQIVVHTDDPQIYLDKLQEALTDVCAMLVESDEFYNRTEIPDAVATLIRFNGELVKA